MVHFQTFGKYEIVRKLSRSLTDVYLARDAEIDRLVVLKKIEHSRDDFTQLVIEAERRGAILQKQLHEIDSRVLQIYEYGEQEGCFFVAMEYFEGKTLAEILQVQRRFDAKRAARYAAEICSQLRTLHSFVSDVDGRKTAVVHGDIKPSNVQIGAHDEVRLLDFGIAKVITSTHNLTHHNLGSPSYCSPERISKSQVDAQADLWALGVSLYEMIAGAPPYQAQNTRKLENLIQSCRPPRALPPDCPAPLKAIVTKALAGEIGRRYPSAENFESDLRAFMEDRPAMAEREHPPAWNANATIEKHRDDSAISPATAIARPPPKTLARSSKKRWNDFTTVVALLAGILAGLLIFIPMGYYYRFSTAAAKLTSPKDYAHDNLQSLTADWSLYKELKKRNQFLGQWSPVSSLDAPVRAHLLAGADDILDAFRHSTGEQLSAFDWTRASLCLRDALEIEPSDVKAKGELALCNGYGFLAQNPPKTAQSVDSFRQAERYLPRLADPHLGLARLYTYDFHNVGRGLAEFHQAEQLGYKLGPRETEQQADGYLFRAETALARAKRAPPAATKERAKWLQLARDDMERARNLYEPIAGFSNVSTDLEQLQEDGVEQAQLQLKTVRLVTPRARASKRYASVRRWQ